MGPVLIYEIRRKWPRRPRRTDPERAETIHYDAKLTYVVVFPEFEEGVREVRLVVPGVSITDDDGATRELDFEVVFDQIIEVEPR